MPRSADDDLNRRDFLVFGGAAVAADAARLARDAHAFDRPLWKELEQRGRWPTNPRLDIVRV